jgi:amino acid transporter
VADTPEPSIGGDPPPEEPAPTHAPKAEHEGERVRVQRPGRPDVEGTEIVQGRKAGTQYARRVREGERKFERGADEGTFRATRRATAPGTRGGRFFERLRRVLFGAPIASEELEEQRLPRWKALPVFASDALSSSAYATDEILLVLAGGGVLLSTSVPIAGAICVLLAIVTFSYRQTIKAYPSGGGAYIVARTNLGDEAGLLAAAGLSVGYTLTVAVSIAAGVFAVVSAFPELADFKVPIAIGAVATITLLNLRGLRESGTIFAIPTYGFILAFGTMLVVGFIRLIIDPDLQAEELDSWEEAGSTAVMWFIVLRAFASGSAALTGVEAISNGIPAFEKPAAKNAAATLLMMAIILGTLFLGITILANQFGVQHSGEVSAPAQIAKTVFGETPIFYLIQAFTALILFLAANTAYQDFPRLGSILARDRFLPHQFLFRGDRLAFSNGIIVLGVMACVLLVVFQASVNRLIPLYAFGVFLSFTLSQSGMVRHWLRVKGLGWKVSASISGIGAVTTGVVAFIVGSTNFLAGAWISMVMISILAVILWSIYRHYMGVERRLEVPDDAVLWFPPEIKQGQAVLVPVDEINSAVLRTVEYARSISKNVAALHVTDAMEDAQALREEWNRRVMDVDLVLINSPYRSFVRPFISYVDALDKVDPGQYVTVVLPEFRTKWPWQRFLHNQSARRLKNALLERPNTVIIEVPIHLGIAAKSKPA